MNPNAGIEIPQAQPLATWRLIAGIGVLGSLVAVILALAPVYIENLRLGSYVRALASAPASATVTDETIRSEVLQRASQLDLPVHREDVRITHNGGKLQLQVKYRVQMDLAIYPVDLHFHPEANSP
jgi:Domain of unknown function (DUF4845)